MTRAYTVAEIDRMRRAVREQMTDVDFSKGHVSQDDPGWPRPAAVEDRLRTYILAGVEPADLEATTPPAAPADPAPQPR